jgi:TetR/AcrR family transcriptional regulator
MIKQKQSSLARDTDTEQRILDAAHAVFLKRGTAGARTQEIAELAGVNKALLHYYFRSKARLAEAVFQRAAQQLLPPVIAVLSSDLEVEEKVTRVVEIELDNLSRTPLLPGYIISELNHHPERARQFLTAVAGDPEKLRPRVFDALRQQIEGRVRAGTMRAIDPQQFIVNLLSMCIFPFAVRPMLTVMMGLDDEGFRRFIAQRRTELVSFFLGALRP